MGIRSHMAALVVGHMLGAGASSEVQAYIPKADCARCKHRVPDVPGSHCYMFREKPGERCGQFSVDWMREDQTRRAEIDERVAAIREERAKRKRENFLKRGGVA